MKPSKGLLSRLVDRIALSLGLVRASVPPPEALRDGTTEPIDPTTRFEPGDVNARGVLWTGIATLVTLWIIVLLIFPVFQLLRHERARSSPPPVAAAKSGNPLPPEPRLQDDPRRDLDQMRAYELSELNSYHWVDRAHGIVSIPIDDAIRIIAQRGIPPQPAPQDQTYFDPHEGTRLTGFEGKVEPEPR